MSYNLCSSIHSIPVIYFIRVSFLCRIFYYVFDCELVVHVSYQEVNFLARMSCYPLQWSARIALSSPRWEGISYKVQSSVSRKCNLSYAHISSNSNMYNVQHWVYERNMPLPEITSGRDSVENIAILCGIDGPGIESLRERHFPHQYGPDLGPSQLPVQLVPRLFLWVKAAGT
jgi:hypothetical protein